LFAPTFSPVYRLWGPGCDQKAASSNLRFLYRTATGTEATLPRALLGFCKVLLVLVLLFGAAFFGVRALSRRFL
jgi:hypothetical protein